MEEKFKRDIVFYYWVGIFIYAAVAVLNIIHLYQWKGRIATDFIYHLVFLGVDVAVIARVRELSNAARRFFVAKFIFLSLFFYPQILLAEPGGWVYSGHWPHGVFQRVANMSLLVYELMLTIHLNKRSVRLFFAHRPQK